MTAGTLQSSRTLVRSFAARSATVSVRPEGADAILVLAERGRALTFRSPSRLAARMLDWFGLTALIEIEPDPRP